MRPILFPPVALVLLLGGCAGVHWSKEGADAATVSRDLDACRAEALRRAGTPVSPARSRDAVTDRSTSPAMSPTAGSNERFVAEQEEIQRCMQKRGYQARR